MPFTQTAEAALDALVTKIDGAVAALGLVTREAKHAGQLAPDQFPACFVQEETGGTNHFITATNEFDLRVLVYIAFKANDTPRATANGYLDSIIAAVSADLDLADTCIWCLPADKPTPAYFPQETGISYVGQFFTLRYWRDF